MISLLISLEAISALPASLGAAVTDAVSVALAELASRPGIVELVALTVLVGADKAPRDLLQP